MDKENVAIDTLYDGVLDDGSTELERLLQEKISLESRITYINIEIQKNLLLNNKVMESYKFSLVEENGIVFIYSKGKYRVIIDITEPDLVSVMSGMNTKVIKFYIPTIDAFEGLLKSLQIF